MPTQLQPFRQHGHVCKSIRSDFLLVNWQKRFGRARCYTTKHLSRLWDRGAANEMIVTVKKKLKRLAWVRPTHGADGPIAASRFEPFLARPDLYSVFEVCLDGKSLSPRSG